MKLMGNNNEMKYEVGNFSEELNRKAEKIVVRKEKKNLELNIVKSDYIQIPGKDFVIAIDSIKAFGYYEMHVELMKKGLQVPTIKEFMEFYKYFMGRNGKKKMPIYDAAMNPLSEKTINDVYHALTHSSEITLNGRFIIDEKRSDIISITELDSNGNYVQRIETLKNYSQEKGYIDFRFFNRHGLPLGLDSSNNFKIGKNIYYSPPKNHSIAKFKADNICFLDCGITLSPSPFGLKTLPIKMIPNKQK